VRQTDQEVSDERTVTATYIVDEDGWLRIADRSSEHVDCAGRRPVLAAGEITFTITPPGVLVSSVTNQSTGYCPEPESWPAVRTALERAGLVAPPSFSPAFVFRRCPRCGSINIIKDRIFECAVCSAPLPAEWNLDGPETERAMCAPLGKRSRA
jgi:hypothetical protein